MAGKWSDSRPMAPHLQIWRWHPAMLSSILHRASAIICYVGLIKVALGMLFCLCLCLFGLGPASPCDLEQGGDDGART